MENYPDDEYNYVTLDDLEAQGETQWWQRDDEPEKPQKTVTATVQKYIYQIGRLYETVADAERIMVDNGVSFYDRGGSLVRPIVDDILAVGGGTLKSARLTPVLPPYMTKEMSRVIDWAAYKKTKTEITEVAIDPPASVAAAILADAGDWPFHKISGIITAPTLRRDGSILWREGYDEKTKLLLVSPPKIPKNFPQNPTREDAAHAILRLDKLLDSFPFDDRGSRSVALSGMITPVVRAAMTVAPLHVVSAPTAGSGKSFLVDLCVALISGNTAPATPIGKTEDETEKRLSAAMMEGSPIIVLDNVNGQLYGDALCQCVERPIVKFRVLGESRMMEIENKTTIFATGNNISPVDDMTRRSIVCNLDANTERPELRQFDSNPLKDVLKNRSQYIADALTIVRAYKLAGMPGTLPRLASFEEWSDLVRSAIVWLGYPDPLETMDRVRDADGRLDSLKAFVAQWYDAKPTGLISSADLVDLSLSKTELQVAMKAFVNPRNQVDGQNLGTRLRAVDGKVVDGFKIYSEKDAHRKIKMWGLKPV